MKLEQYIEKQQKTLKQAAEELGLAYEDIRRYCKGSVIPRPENMKKITEWSKGEVQPNDFYGISHEAFMKEMDDFEKEMDADFRRINHLDEKADINQILGEGQGE